eukprot:1698967-Alexandrium_andersonii.AAC.1
MAGSPALRVPIDGRGPHCRCHEARVARASIGHTQEGRRARRQHDKLMQGRSHAGCASDLNDSHHEGMNLRG